ncbi:hypothetical protein TIFTF001_026937 [Ficus carica]|uniref:Retrotransposon gag domain-containing protein n=1 Tax=Ficus carica TaxID=3494 RepID=A0AA88DM41_FICCA|nr:hypothetical protein TIFTF001_026937 [Ficus carica]
MVRPRAAAARRPQEANLAEMVVNLQCRLEDQVAKCRISVSRLLSKIKNYPLRQLSQLNLQHQLCLRHKPSNLWSYKNRFLNFMDLTDQEKVFCASYVMNKDARYWWEIVQIRRNVLEMTWNDFIQEFNNKFYNRMAMKAQQNEFNNIKQGTMSVTEAVRKFDQLIVVVIDSGEKPRTTVAECVERALRAEYRLAQATQERAKFFEEKKKEKSQSKQNQGNQLNSQGNRFNLNGNHSNQNHNKRKRNFNGNKNQKNHPQKKNNTVYPTCSKCGKKHLGECKLGSNTCYLCGKEGHYAKNYYTNKQIQTGQN